MPMAARSTHHPGSSPNYMPTSSDSFFLSPPNLPSQGNPTSDGSWEDALLSCLEPLICKAAMPIAAHRAAGFKSKGLLRPVLRCLAALQRLLPVRLWSQAWASVGVTFWLSR